MNLPKYSYQKALFIFRRDLRIEDNTALLYALNHAKVVIPCFIFNPDQLENNSYKSDSCLQFMLESLEDLEQQLSNKKAVLNYFYGHPEDIVEECIKKLDVEAVFVNQDYTPYSLLRDQNIASICKKYDRIFLSFKDLLLHPPEETLKRDSKPYTVFTPYYKNALKFEVDTPQSNYHVNYERERVPFSSPVDVLKKILPKRRKQAKGGREAALKILNQLEAFKNYPFKRDFPFDDETTHLSAHLKFTTCSIREIYWAICRQYGSDSELLRALYWRDFFTMIGLYFPHVFSGAFHKRYDALKWGNDVLYFEKWCSGTTGFPIVDAGMRQMNQTGFMHNRVRMIVASFLVKDLHVDWRWGEKYFAQKLIDYDPCVNNGNWQWAASTGCDAQPYFRIFNPWLQGEKFDKDCRYIKQWIPELGQLTSKEIHRWYTLNSSAVDYPEPCVDHATESKKSLALYRNIQ